MKPLLQNNIFFVLVKPTSDQRIRSAYKHRAMISLVAKTLVTLVHCCTAANFLSVYLLLFNFSFFALFFNVLYEQYYFFTSNTLNLNNIRSIIYILVSYCLLISSPSSGYLFLLLSSFPFIWSNDYG